MARKDPKALRAAKSEGFKAQYGALCWKEKDGKIRVLLVTSRRTGRWVIPKGWPMPDQRPYGAALTEADEEAGVEGKVDSTCIGVFRYIKHADRPDALPCAVAVYPVQVNRLKKTWREKAERKRKWFSQKRAAAEVGEADLAQIIREFDPKRRS